MYKAKVLCRLFMWFICCRFFLASFYTKYDPYHFAVNAVSLLSVLLPKLPIFHGVRIFGINKYWVYGLLVYTGSLICLPAWMPGWSITPSSVSDGRQGKLFLFKQRKPASGWKISLNDSGAFLIFNCFISLQGNVHFNIQGLVVVNLIIERALPIDW